MATTRREMYEWLRRTGPPRSIYIRFPSPNTVTFEVGCDVGWIIDCGLHQCSSCDPRKASRHGKTLAEARTFKRAQLLRDKYRRWLKDFKAAEAAGDEHDS